jgi:ABC-type multidrug transport system fused ATPase/permease subunit
MEPHTQGDILTTIADYVILLGQNSVVWVLIAFGLGYGLREIISRRRRKKLRRRHRETVDLLTQHEMEFIRTLRDADTHKKNRKTARQPPELPELPEQTK